MELNENEENPQQTRQPLVSHVTRLTKHEFVHINASTSPLKISKANLLESSANKLKNQMEGVDL